MKKVILFIIVTVSLFTLTACSTASTDSTISTVSKSSATGSKSEEPTPEPTPEKTNLSLGSNAVLGNWEITATKFEIRDRIDSDFNGYYSPDEGNKYAVVSVEVTNNGKEADTFLPTFSYGDSVRAKIMYEDYEFSATNVLSYSPDLHDKHLNPLSSSSGEIIFSIPESVIDKSLQLVLSAGKDSLIYDLG